MEQRPPTQDDIERAVQELLDGGWAGSESLGRYIISSLAATYPEGNPYA